MRVIHKGATSQTVYFSVNDSASTTGGKKTGIAFNAAGLVASYTRNGAARTAITLATQTASGAWSSGGWVEVDATNEPGLYRFDVPDAAFASGVDSVVIQVRGATGMVDAVEEVQLTAVDFQDAVRAALTALPNANAEAAGGLYTRGAGAGQINQQTSGQIDSNLARWLNVAPAALSTNGYVQAMLLRWLTDNAGGTPNALTSGRVDSIIGAITAGIIAAGSFAANALDAVWSTTTRTLSAFGFSVTVGINNDKTGYSLTVTPPTAAAISTQVWTEPIPGAFGAGSAGAKLNSASAAGDPWATLVPAAYGAGTAGNKLGNLSGASGSGANTIVVTVQNDATHPVAGAQFWVTTDVGGTNIIASGTTDTFGKVTVFLNNGTFYGWAAKPGENFSNPITMVIP